MPIYPFARFAIAITFLLTLPTPSFAHEWMAPQEAAARKNPEAAESASVDHGKVMYGQNCAFCHGKDGKGAIPSAPDLIAGLKSHSDGDYFWKIENGRDGMPSFGSRLQESEIWDIINYIKTLP